MTHARHTCLDCGLYIEPDEPEAKVPPERVQRIRERRRAAGLSTAKYDNIHRYTHVSQEACFEAEKKAAAW